MSHLFQELRTQIQHRFQSAQQRIDDAKSQKQMQYFKGQADTLRVVLQDIDAAKFELGVELDDEPPLEPVTTRKPRKVRKTRTSQKKPVPPVSPYKELADRAVKAGIITQSGSHFMHELLPKGHAQGFYQLYDAFEENEHLRNAIQETLESGGSSEGTSSETS